MADTGFKFAGAGVNVGGLGPDWTLPGNVVADDAADTIVICGNNIISDVLNTDTYGFAIPSGATIDGVEVEIVDYTGVAGGA